MKRRCDRVIGPDAKGASYLAELPMLASGNPQFYRVQDSQLGGSEALSGCFTSTATSIKGQIALKLPPFSERALPDGILARQNNGAR